MLPTIRPTSAGSEKSTLLALREAAVPRDVSPKMVWLETIAVPLGGAALAWWFRPDDPVLSSADFPWLWLAPVLVALRYGSLPGLLAIAPLLANWFLADRLMNDIGAFPQSHFFGGILLTLLCGEFADVWRERTVRLEETNVYLSERVSRLTRRHLLLNLSHDRLEQEMLMRPGTIRDAIVSLREKILNSDRPDGFPALAELFEILGQYTNIQAASFHAVDAAQGNRISAPLYTLGTPAPLSADDELLKMALEEGELVHVADFSSVSTKASNQLVIAPVMASNRQILAVVAVSKIPFLALQAENLQLLSVILAYYADNLHSAPNLAAIRRHLPSIPPLFGDELWRMLALQERFGIDSHIVVMKFRGSIGDQIVGEFLGIKRGIDLYWQTVVDGLPTIAVLMPFTTPSGKEGFLGRIEKWLRTRFGGDFETLEISVRAIDLAGSDPLTALQREMGG